MSTQASPPLPPQPTVKRTEDFVSRYANNVRFESTVFDLKVLFGQTDLSEAPKEIILQHTAVTFPWADVKLAIYYLTTNLIAHEYENGKVHLPPSQVPPELPPLAPEFAKNPLAQEAHKAIAKYREEFIAANR
jgi:hypothetical protein